MKDGCAGNWHSLTVKVDMSGENVTGMVTDPGVYRRRLRFRPDKMSSSTMVRLTPVSLRLWCALPSTFRANASSLVFDPRAVGQRY